MRENGIIWVLLATLFMMTAFGFIKTADFQNRLKAQQVILTRQAKDGVQTTRAACSYRDFLLREYRAGEAYLRRNPEGLPALRISRAQIESSISRERRAYVSLSGLVCTRKALAPPPAPPATTTARR